MKICYIAPLNSIHTYKWIKYFNNLGYKIYCIGNEDINNKIDGIKYFSFNKRIKKNILFKIPLLRIIGFTIFGLKIIKKIKPDITHIHFIGIGTLIALFYKKTTLITTVWGSDILILPKRIPLFKQLIKRILNNSKIITTDGYNILNELLKYGINQNKIKMIGFGIDTKIFKKNKGEKKSKEKIKIISLRSLNPIYDIKTIIYAAYILKNKGEKFIIYIYGDGSEKEKLINLTKELGLNNYINFKGKYNNKKLPKYLNKSDIYVSVSLSDSGLAGSTGEAMACGLPIITTNNGDNSKWISNYINGFIIPNKSPKQLANKIQYFIKNKKEINKMGDKNISIISDRNDYYNEMNKVNNIYIKLKNDN